MNLVLPDKYLPAKILLAQMNDDRFFAFCMANRDARFERTAQREVVLVPRAGGESDYRTLNAAAQLSLWAERKKTGKPFGSSVAFLLASGAALSPDAAWVSNARMSSLTKEQRRKFLPVCPEFVIEVMSPSDRVKAARQKMIEWIANGAKLGWLIDGDNRTVYVFRAGEPEPEVRKGIQRLAGEGPVAGFRLDLSAIWKGL